MKLTKPQREALEAARDFNNAWCPGGRPMGVRRHTGGAYRRMVDRLVEGGLLDNQFSITPAGRLALHQHQGVK